MAALVTTPLERQFGQISGITMMSSDSSAGLSTIVIQFDMGRDIDAAGQDVQSAIADAIYALTAARKPTGILVGNVEDGARYAELGCRFIAMGSDAGTLARGLRDLANKARIAMHGG